MGMIAAAALTGREPRVSASKPALASPSYACDEIAKA